MTAFGSSVDTATAPQGCFCIEPAKQVQHNRATLDNISCRDTETRLQQAAKDEMSLAQRPPEAA